jgi:putative membrane-bound dehydrogenase-like protein
MPHRHRCWLFVALIVGVLLPVVETGGAEKKIAFMAGRPSHGYGSHEHYAGCKLLAAAIERALPGYETVVYQNGWPEDPKAFQDADVVVMYCDGGGGHPVNQHLEQLDKLADEGVGVVCLHYGVEVPKGEPGDHFLKWIGGYFETHWSVNPHWEAEFTSFPDHPVSRGVEPFTINDEWYYHMRFRPEMKGVTPILTAIPPESTLSRPDGPHSGNPHVRAKAGQPQHVAWVAERENGGRGFGFTGGHFHWNWGDPNFRKVVLNAIAWTAHDEIPEDGVQIKPVTLTQLEANQDYDPPQNFDRRAIQTRLKLAPERKKAGKASGPAPKPVYASPVIDVQTEGHQVNIEADITGAKELYLVVTDGGNGYSCDWADWAEPRLVGPKGELKLTDLNWKSASADFGQVRKNKNVNGGEMKINGQSVAYGLGTHANSTVAYDLPEGYTRFVARGGLDNGGTDQGACGSQTSVQFFVYTQKPRVGGDQREAENALAGLDIAEGLEATLFASEPDLKSVTNLDIDDRGRIWVCEVMNYRGNNGSRPEGDRILILEDTDKDGVCDNVKEYYQGRDVDSAMGICVLGNKVIVSCAPNVIIFTDEDGDDVPDKKEMLFTNTGQPQHDHSAHSVLFGPDGKLYWNVGNTGKQVCDAEGNLIVDKAGNKVVDNGKPYFGGMPFRCNPDGSEFEVLGHNFRNNYEVTVDSFGTLWQSDNDDDGNRGVRINYVMEFGNYGYRDEMTGAGWQTARTGMSDEIPLRHWHLNDPGVVPNLLQTGAGSPTGITVYEGRLLPKVFWDQVIHCDAGPNVVRAYPVERQGAGYSATMENILTGTRDKWFRPADVCVAPDGSIFVTDWYDPGVGGHAQGDLDRGRIFRLAPPGSEYQVPKQDYESLEGCIKALQSPAASVRYIAWQKLQAAGEEAVAPLKVMAQDANPRMRARALWLLGKISGQTPAAIELAIQDPDSDVRTVALRLARQTDTDVIAICEALVKDPSPQVRREVAIALRNNKSEQVPELWAELAAQHDGKDRWYLEALGIGAEGQWDACFGAWIKLAGERWNTPAGRDIIWRSRATATPGYLAKILLSEDLPAEEQPRYFRAFDFLSGPEKEKALESLLGL